LAFAGDVRAAAAFSCAIIASILPLSIAPMLMVPSSTHPAARTSQAVFHVPTLSARSQTISSISAENRLLFPRLKTLAVPIIRSHRAYLMGKHDVKTANGNKAIHDAGTKGTE
jgi:hypothetical protein